MPSVLYIASVPAASMMLMMFRIVCGFAAMILMMLPIVWFLAATCSKDTHDASDCLLSSVPRMPMMLIMLPILCFPWRFSRQ